MATEPNALLRDKSAPDSPSYALRAALAERLAGHRAVARDAGRGLEALYAAGRRLTGKASLGETVPSGATA